MALGGELGINLFSSFSLDELVMNLIVLLKEEYRSFKKPHKKVKRGYSLKALKFLAKESVEIARIFGYTHFLTLAFPSDEVGKRVIKRLREWFRKEKGKLWLPIGIRGVRHYHLFVKLNDEKQVYKLKKWLRRQVIKEKLRGNFFSLKQVRVWKFHSYFVKNLEEAVDYLKDKGERVNVDKLVIGGRLVKELLLKDKTFRRAFKYLLSVIGAERLRLGKIEYVREKNANRKAIIFQVVKRILNKLGLGNREKKLRGIMKIYNNEGIIRPSDLRFYKLSLKVIKKLSRGFFSEVCDNVRKRYRGEIVFKKSFLSLKDDKRIKGNLKRIKGNGRGCCGGNDYIDS